MNERGMYLSTSIMEFLPPANQPISVVKDDKWTEMVGYARAIKIYPDADISVSIFRYIHVTELSRQFGLDSPDYVDKLYRPYVREKYDSGKWWSPKNETVMPRATFDAFLAVLAIHDYHVWDRHAGRLFLRGG